MFKTTDTTCFSDILLLFSLNVLVKDYLLFLDFTKCNCYKKSIPINIFFSFLSIEIDYIMNIVCKL